MSSTFEQQRKKIKQEEKMLKKQAVEKILQKRKAQEAISPQSIVEQPA